MAGGGAAEGAEEFVPPSLASPATVAGSAASFAAYGYYPANAGPLVPCLLTPGAVLLFELQGRFVRLPMAEATPDLPAQVSWSDIPLDVALVVLCCLPAHVDRVRFAAVCPQWRSAAWQGPLPPPLPLLALQDGTVYSLPPCAGYADACGGNWLFFSALVSVRHRCRIALCKPGAASWWSVHLDSQLQDFSDIAFYQGKLYAFDYVQGDLCTIDTSVDYSTDHPCISQIRRVINGTIVFKATTIQDFVIVNTVYLVESRGALLMVKRKMYGIVKSASNEGEEDAIYANGNNNFEVFQASTNCCFSGAGALESSSSCSVYNMKDDKISTIMPTASWKRGTVTATWLFPQD
ncbi:hypothetical protein QOZ80_9AG0688470 [Eleusine coracana subsp. coracana]|nr:hypothetical protein QOZ80_9AG0688470 [Eleusine coracana subsp. coracana]